MAGPGRPKGQPKTGGRKKGTPNKVSGSLKEAILEAATKAGGDGGLVGYLKTQANSNPQSFIPLLGKVLPMQVAGDPDNPVRHRIEIAIVGPDNTG